MKRKIERLILDSTLAKFPKLGVCALADMPKPRNKNWGRWTRFVAELRARPDEALHFKIASMTEYISARSGIYHAAYACDRRASVVRDGLTVYATLLEDKK